ncbi:MAG: clostripain-related cysteine peptidase [Melioribacteraceae bacterium]
MVFASAALTMFLFSCRSISSEKNEWQAAEESGIKLKYSMVFVIHGDGDYIYHNSIGTEFNADETALANAKRVAEQNPNAEVFIFHQRPKQKFLFFFPQRDGEFYYYRRGRLIKNILYWRDQEKSNFDTEVSLYHQFHTVNLLEMLNLFLYFGHEIPEFNGLGYDESYPDRTFTINDIANGLKDFTRNFQQYDLLVLSTCFGGTPYKIGELGQFAQYIISSPENLHLSYFNLHSLHQLDFTFQDGDVFTFAKKFASEAFDSLAKDIQTAVSVAVYDVNRTEKYLKSVQKIYDSTLINLKGTEESSIATTEHCDCAEIPKYVLPMMTDGVNIFYRPANFGRTKYKQYHSGWECLREKELQNIIPRNSESSIK